MKKIILGLLYLVIHHFTYAQHAEEHHGRIQADITLLPQKDIYSELNHNSSYDSLNGNFGYKLYRLSAKIPVYHKFSNKSNGKPHHYTRISIDPYFSYQAMNLSWFVNKHDIYRAGLSASGVYINGTRNLFLASAGGFIANDQYTISQPKMRYSGRFIYKRTSSKTFSWHAGVIYAYTFGTGIPIPTIGVNFKAGNKGRMNINLPFGITYTHRNNEKFTYKIFFRPRGNVATLTNQFGEFHTYSNNIVLRQRENVLGYSAAITSKHHWHYTLEGGLAARRFLYVSETSTGVPINFEKGLIKPCFYLKFGVAYIFSAKHRDKHHLSSHQLDDEEMHDEEMSEEVLEDDSMVELFN